MSLLLSSLYAAVVVVTNLGFTAAYDTDLRNPLWVQYDLEPSEVVQSPRAAIPFRHDPRVPNTDNALDYARSGYDRGHLAPAADFNWNRQALAETYLFSNICPMHPNLNRGRWSENEAEVRRLATSTTSTVHVLIIPIFNQTNRIGNVTIPSAFLKIAYGPFGSKTWYEQNN